MPPTILVYALLNLWVGVFVSNYVIRFKALHRSIKIRWHSAWIYHAPLQSAFEITWLPFWRSTAVIVFNCSSSWYRTIRSVEEHIRDSILKEIMSTKSTKGIQIDLPTLEIKRTLDADVLNSASFVRERVRLIFICNELCCFNQFVNALVAIFTEFSNLDILLLYLPLFP